jgi:hypothetical protein
MELGCRRSYSYWLQDGLLRGRSLSPDMGKIYLHFTSSTSVLRPTPATHWVGS